MSSNYGGYFYDVATDSWRPIGGGGAGRGVAYIATDYGISTAASDNTEALQALVDRAAEKGGGVIFFPPGTYDFASSATYDKNGMIIDYAVLLKSNVSILGAGVRATVLRQTEPIPYSLFFRIDPEETPLVGCRFEGFTVDAYQTGDVNQVWGKAFYAQYLRDCVFRDLQIRGTVATGLGIDYLDRVTIDNVTCIDCGRTFTGDEPGSSGIGIGTGGWREENFVITDCICVGSGQYGIFIENQYNIFGSGHEPYSRGAIISGCIVRGGMKYGIGIRGGENVTVIGCESYGNANNGIHLENKCRNIHIAACHADGNGGSGIGINPDSESIGITLDGCTATDNGGFGIRVAGESEALTIRDCTTRGNDLGLSIKEGIVLRDAAIWNNVLIDGADIAATFTGNTRYINAETTENPAVIVLTGEELMEGIKIMPDGSESQQADALSSNYLDITGIEGDLRITSTGQLSQIRVAQYGADYASLQSDAALVNASTESTHVMDVARLEGAAYIRIFYTPISTGVPSAVEGVVVEAAT